MPETIFCQKTKFLAATSNLRVEQNLVHLSRFLHFSQKVVGVTLIDEPEQTDLEKETNDSHNL